MPLALKKAHADVTPEAQSFYTESIRLLRESGIPFLIAGTYAFSAYTGIVRRTKDLDVFCKAGDYPRILKLFQDHGYRTVVKDERWIAKVKKGRCFFDVIFGSTSAVVSVGDAWFADAYTAEVCGVDVQILSPTEFIWSKAFVQDRTRYDGADIAHVILRHADKIDWKRLLSHMEQYWEVLLMHVLNFRFIYPSERDRVPRWLLDELLTRLRERADLPPPQTRICRGRLFSRTDYTIDVREWGLADIVGEEATADGRGS